MRRHRGWPLLDEILKRIRPDRLKNERRAPVKVNNPVLHELLDCTDEMKALIKGKAEVARLREQAIADGMTTLKQDGILKCLQGLTYIHEVRRVCIK